jgi:hypothetical protein
MTILAYWPTVLWLLGFLEFWVQLGSLPLPLGISVWAAVALAVACVVRKREALERNLQAIQREILQAPLLFKLLLLLCCGLMLVGLLESRHPPHLIQEGDVMVYHVAIPRQHLLFRTAGHIPWSVADLFPMALQWGFAPAWLMNDTVTKWPQAAAALWLTALMIGLGRSTAGHDRPAYLGWIPGLAALSSHGIMVQLGTAMMDLPILYCAVAAWHALRRRRIVWAALHLALFATAKSFSPFQTILVFGIALIVMLASRSARPAEALHLTVRPALLCLGFSILLLARSAVVGMRVAGTPLFPFFVCMDASAPGCAGPAEENIRESARQHLGTRDVYGNGRGLKALISHVWRVAVPTQGVNNEYDYPLGLPWLIGVLLLIISLVGGIRERRVTAECAVALAFWVVWWAGSHQSRWLYPTIAFAWLGTQGLQRLIERRVLLGALAVSGAFSLISQWRSLGPALARPSTDIQAEQVRRVARDAEGHVTDLKTLYVEEAIRTHKGHGPLWLISK